MFTQYVTNMLRRELDRRWYEADLAGTIPSSMKLRTEPAATPRTPHPRVAEREPHRERPTHGSRIPDDGIPPHVFPSASIRSET